jgi:hypothetical protein
MSYYIAPHTTSPTENIVIYRVVKRLGDFKPEDGKIYRVFKSKKEKASYKIPLYEGVNGKLKKQGNVVRFFPGVFV